MGYMPLRSSRQDYSTIQHFLNKGGFQVFIAVVMGISASWDKTLCRLVKTKRSFLTASYWFLV
jgi:hypothetical protein